MRDHTTSRQVLERPNFCSNSSAYMSCQLPAKYANLSKHEWAKFVRVKIPDLEKGELDVGSSNFRMACLFCNLVFTGGKTRVIGPLIGDGAKCVTTCDLASEEARLVRKKGHN